MSQGYCELPPRGERGEDKPKIARENFIKRPHAARTKLRGETLSVASCCRNLRCVRPFTRRATQSW